MPSRREFLQAAGLAALAPCVLKADEPRFPDFNFDMEYEEIQLPPIKGKLYIYCEDRSINDGVFIKKMEANCYDEFAHKILEEYPTVYGISLYVYSESLEEPRLARIWEKTLAGQWWCFTEDYKVPGWQWPSPPAQMVVNSNPVRIYCL